LNTDAGAGREEETDQIGLAEQLIARYRLTTPLGQLESAHPLFIFGRMAGFTVLDVALVNDQIRIEVVVRKHDVVRAGTGRFR
jgi:hypothetical protein